jgi:hypothetical protein
MSESQMVLDQKIRNHQDKIFSVLDNTAITLLFGQQFEQPLCMFHALDKCLMAKWFLTKRNGSATKPTFSLLKMYVGQMSVGQMVFNQKK